MQIRKTVGMLTAMALVGFAGCSESPTATRSPKSLSYSTAATTASTVSAWVSGPSYVYPSTQGTCSGTGSSKTCYTWGTYTAHVSGGTTPYSYVWEVLYSNGNHWVGQRTSSSSFQFEMYNFDSPGLQVRVTVYSADGSQATSGWFNTTVS